MTLIVFVVVVGRTCRVSKICIRRLAVGGS